MLYPELEEKLHKAKQALAGASSENIIALCQQYLMLLAEYRAELYKLPDTPGVNLQPSSSSSLKDVRDTRQAVRTAIENSTQERNRTAKLLHSFTVVSGYEAVGTLNRLKYRGHDDWKSSAGGVRFSDGTDGFRMTIQGAVDTASLLRREEYIAHNALAWGRLVDKAQN